jgi:hypothetical protein
MSQSTDFFAISKKNIPAWSGLDWQHRMILPSCGAFEGSYVG